MPPTLYAPASYRQYVESKRAEYGVKFDPSMLADQFIPYYHTGQRIKVQFRDGETLSGTIGATTGWRPCFLLMRTSRSIGSMYTLGKYDKIIARWNGRRYVA